MLWTRTLIPTMKETPEGAEIPSHVLMLRAGLVNQVMAGAYTYLPLGLRALRKAEQIVREEMDAAGAVELLMPAMTPLALWEQTGRVAAFGDVLVQFAVQRQNRKVHVVLGPDARGDRHRPGGAADLQLPPDADHALPDPDQVPQRGAAAVRRAAHQRVPDEGRLQLRRLARVARPTATRDVRGLLPDLRPLRAELPAVEAESGPIGGDASHEFMVPADNGEDTVLHCRAAATRPTRRRPRSAPATCAPPNVAAGAARDRWPRPAPAPSSRSASSSSCKPQQMIKTLIYAGRRPADRRAGPRRPRGQRGEDPPRRQARRSSSWPSRR